MTEIVRAKRLGWDWERTLPPERLWDVDVYEYESDDLEGELQIVEIPATEYTPALTMYLVGGQEADPRTIERQSIPTALSEKGKRR